MQPLSDVRGLPVEDSGLGAGHSDPRITQEHYAFLTPSYDPQIEQILKGEDQSGYNLVTFEPEGTNKENRYPLSDSGLPSEKNWVSDGRPTDTPFGGGILTNL